MSDQQPQPTSGETGTLGAGPAAPDTPAPSEPVTAAAEVEAAKLAPDQEETSPKPDAPKVDAVTMEAPKVEAPKAEAPKMEAPKIDPPKIDAVKPEAPRFPGNVTIMSPGERVGADAKAAPAEGSSGKRRFGAMAAVVALATVAGALGGALATAGIGKLMAGDSAQASAQVSAKDSALEASVARIDAEIVALKAGLEHNSKATTGQLNKASDRLDKVEKAQAEPAAKLAKLSETVDKLRAAQASATTVAAAPAPAKDVTGTIPQQAAAAAAAACACGSVQARSCPAADRRRLGIAGRRQWQRPDREPPRHVRGLCRRSDPRSRPCRRHSQAGRPLGGRDQQGPDRRALTGRYANSKALHGDVRRLFS